MNKLTGVFFENYKTILAFCLAVLVILCAFVHYVVQLDTTNQRVHRQEQVLAQAGDLRTRLEHEIHTTLNLTMGSLIYVASHPDITQEEFAQFANEIIQRAPYIQNLGLAKDNIITHIYPLQGNEQALGLRYLDNAAQRTAVLHAIATKKTVIAGPVNLVQGGQGFISRIPVFLNDASNSYWGITSIVVKVEPFFEKAGLFDVQASLNVALRGNDASGFNGEVFYGDASLFDDPNNVVLSIPLPVGSWVLAAEPKNGWVSGNTRIYKLYTVGISISLLITLLLYSLMIKNVALKREQHKAIMAGEHKNRFFTNMTHELRTPLTAIYGSIRLLKSGKVPVESATWNELFNNADRNCQRLMWVVNDILDLKKLESGKMEYQMALESIEHIVNNAIDEVRQYAEQFHIHMELYNHLQQPAMVNVDSKRFQQVIVNLLSNAIKFSPAGSSVAIDMSQQRDTVKIEVTDHGTGIATDKIQTIFTEYIQAGQSSSNSRNIVASTGLGLSISKKLVEDHGGSIGCYNKENAGAVFFFILPLAARHNNHDNKTITDNDTNHLDPIISASQAK
ncbi:sensor histidine kinase [Kaarinaea lacus]